MVIGQIVDIGPAQWNTSDGAAPPFDEHPPIDAYIFRPATIAVTENIRGDEKAVLKIRLLGGTVDCFAFAFERQPEATKGTTYAFFLGTSVDHGSNARRSDELTVNEAWSVDSSGLVHTPTDGRLSASAFRAAVIAAE